MAHDVNQSEKDVAAQVRSALVDRISSERYDLWIPKQTIWTWNDNRLTLDFPSDFSCQIAKNMLHDDLAELLTSVVGAGCPNGLCEVVFSATVPRAESSLSSIADERAKPPPPNRLKSASNIGAQAPLVPSDSDGTDATQPDPNGELWSRFVRGQSNELAWTTANLAVNDPGRLTPILIHGPHGSGKSLLAAAIAQQLRGARRMRRVVHMTSEQFTNDFMEGLRGGGLPMFRRKYRDVEALILDDVQFFIGKKSTLAEVRHTLDNLLQLGKQVVFTADRSLNELQALGNELVGRIRGGLISPLFPLDEATRAELLKRMLADARVDVGDEVLTQLACRTAGDGRVLSGIAKRLTATASLLPGKLGWDQCWNAVFDLVQATRPIVRIGDIERVVCNVFGLQADSLQSSSKMRSVSQPRMLAMFLARKYTPAAYKEIGEYFGSRRHSTVISAEKTVEGWLRDRSDINCGSGLNIRDAIRHVESQLQVG